MTVYISPYVLLAAVIIVFAVAYRIMNKTADSNQEHRKNTARRLDALHQRLRKATDVETFTCRAGALLGKTKMKQIHKAMSQRLFQEINDKEVIFGMRPNVDVKSGRRPLSSIEDLRDAAFVDLAEDYLHALEDKLQWQDTFDEHKIGDKFSQWFSVSERELRFQKSLEKHCGSALGLFGHRMLFPVPLAAAEFGTKGSELVFLYGDLTERDKRAEQPNTSGLLFRKRYAQIKGTLNEIDGHAVFSVSKNGPSMIDGHVYDAEPSEDDDDIPWEGWESQSGLDVLDKWHAAIVDRKGNPVYERRYLPVQVSSGFDESEDVYAWVYVAAR